MAKLILMAAILAGLATVAPSIADDVPIAGVVKSVDLAAQTFVVETTARGQTRQVTIYVKPSSRVIRFVRAEQGRGALVEIGRASCRERVEVAVVAVARK